MTVVLGGTDPPGATPLEPDDLDGLIPSDIATRGDLDRAELENIVDARTWAVGRRWEPDRVLRVEVLRDLHRRMFRDVWRWAGELRRRETSIGVAPEVVTIELRNLVDDTAFWLANGTYDLDEAVLRFHHRLVQVHAFRNGNGRHARFCADLLARGLRLPPYTWGGQDLADATAARAAYLTALRAMDANRDEFGPLRDFARA